MEPVLSDDVASLKTPETPGGGAPAWAHTRSRALLSLSVDGGVGSSGSRSARAAQRALSGPGARRVLRRFRRNSIRSKQAAEAIHLWTPPSWQGKTSGSSSRVVGCCHLSGL